MNVLVLGAGQLARMMALATTPLNIQLRAYDVNTKQVVNPLAPDQSFGNLQQGIDEADVITAEFEHISHDILVKCRQSGKLQPSDVAIKTGGDRRLEKALLEQCQVPNAKHVIVNKQVDFEQALNQLSLPIIFKSALEGYDGKGQWRLKTADQASALWQELVQFLADNPKQAIVAEQMVPFEREVSVIGVRDAKGNTKIYPLTENVHQNGVLSISIAQQTSTNIQQQAVDAFNKIAKQLDYIGVLAIEFFQLNGKLLVNEIAPRVHNSGHWTQQGADTCQFENHVRAVAGLPLGSTALVRPTAMINILGEDQVPSELLAIPSLTLHWYGKSKRAGRKMGHINLCGDNKQQLAERLQQVADLLAADKFIGVSEIAKQFSQS